MLTNQDKTFQTNSDTSSTSAELSEKTIIIFDFDDTLFCTKYLETFSLCYEDIFKSKVSLEELNPCLYKEIKELENEIIELFITLKQFYDVIIISNADIKWINNCLIHFLDELREYIVDNDIKIFSAKNNKISPKDWKVNCFKNVIKELYKDEYELNIISIGDSNEEKKAVMKFKNSKFIKMISYPSAKSIILELNYLKNNIHNIVLDNKIIHKMKIEIKNNNIEINCISDKLNENMFINKKRKKDNNYVDN